MSSIERSIFKCPVIMKEYYPAPAEETIQYNSLLHGSRIFGSVNTNSMGEEYIEIVFHEDLFYSSDYYRVFIIQRGYLMSEDDESLFVLLCSRTDLKITDNDFADLQKRIHKYIPDIPIRDYNANEIGKYLLRIYYSTHRSGPKEILYKADFENVAYALSEIESYNIIGSSPNRILGIPTTLIRILNQQGLTDRVKTVKARQHALEIYRKYSSHFGRNNLPNIFQWLYLEEASNEKRNLIFDNSIFKKLGECQDHYLYENYIKFSELKMVLGNYNPYKKVPKRQDVVSVVHKMASIIKYIDNMDCLNRKIKFHNKEYLYEEDNFVVINPTTVLELIDEANYQENCLMEYIDKVAAGEANIIFIRKRDNLSVPYVTIQITENCIIQARSRFNELPEVVVFEFLERFARKTWLRYDPYCLITCDEGFELIEDREDLRSYLLDYQRRYELPKFPDDGINGEQLCLWDYFPECFS